MSLHVIPYKNVNCEILESYLTSAIAAQGKAGEFCEALLGRVGAESQAESQAESRSVITHVLSTNSLITVGDVCDALYDVDMMDTANRLAAHMGGVPASVVIAPNYIPPGGTANTRRLTTRAQPKPSSGRFPEVIVVDRSGSAYYAISPEDGVDRFDVSSVMEALETYTRLDYTRE